MKTSDLSIKELAAFIGVSTDTIWRAIRKGGILSKVKTALRFDLQKEHMYAAERRGQVLGHLRPARRAAQTYGRLIGYLMLKPYDLRHGVAMETLEQQHDLEQVRALLGHARINTSPKSTP